MYSVQVWELAGGVSFLTFFSSKHVKLVRIFIGITELLHHAVNYFWVYMQWANYF